MLCKFYNFPLKRQPTIPHRKQPNARPQTIYFSLKPSPLATNSLFFFPRFTFRARESNNGVEFDRRLIFDSAPKRDRKMRPRKCRVWWPKDLSLAKSPLSDAFLFGWFVSSSDSVDVVVAFSCDEDSLADSQVGLEVPNLRTQPKNVISKQIPLSNCSCKLQKNCLWNLDKLSVFFFTLIE